MFVRNRTPFSANVVRSRRNDEIGVASVVVEVVYRIREDGRLEVVDEDVPRGPSDPPDLSSALVWMGVSVTVAGSAIGPDHAPFVCPVSVRVGGALRRIIVFGPRHWELSRGTPQPTAPAAFDRIPLSFSRAFGGSFEVPPGLMPGTNLPHPGFTCFYDKNPGGVGFHASATDAAGRELPNIELPDQLIRQWSDRPDPAGLSPCPELVGFRIAKLLQERSPAELNDQPNMIVPMHFRLRHHAPPSLIFDALERATPIIVEGIGASRVTFEVPDTRVRITTRGADDSGAAMPELMSVHVDVDRRLVRVVHAHRFRYRLASPPKWVRVKEA